MNKEKRNQMFVLIVLVIFVGNGILVAFMYTTPGNDQDVGDEFKVQNVYDRPLSNSEEAVFLRNNIIILKYFYTEDCSGCAEARFKIDGLMLRLPNRMVVEEIDADKYGSHASDLGIGDVPAFYVKGSRIRTLYSNATEDDLFSTVCGLFFVEVEECL